jgi:hypothetical protein
MLTRIENAARVVLVCLIVYLVATRLRPVVSDVWQWTRHHASHSRRLVGRPMTAPIGPPLRSRT